MSSLTCSTERRRFAPVQTSGRMVGLGGGAEYAFGQHVSLGMEYDYADLGTGRHSTGCNCPSGVGGGTPIVDGDIAIQSVTARLNYRFGR